MGTTSSAPASKLDRAMANVGASCFVCNIARRRQHGWVFEFVKRVEGRLCPFCRAYAKVFGRQSHEPVPSQDKSPTDSRTANS